eukprot:1059414-Pyramimonas_sp.AAC.1
MCPKQFPPRFLASGSGVDRRRLGRVSEGGEQGISRPRQRRGLPDKTPRSIEDLRAGPRGRCRGEERARTVDGLGPVAQVVGCSARQRQPLEAKSSRGPTDRTQPRVAGWPPISLMR